MRSVADTLTHDLVHHLPASAVAQRPDAPAVTDAHGTWTYAELDARSAAFATWLGERGVARGDRVLSRIGNVREFVAMLFGTLRHGAVFVPIGAGMKAYHLNAVLEDCAPALVVAAETDGGVPPGPHVHMLEKLWPEVEEIALGGPEEPEPARPEVSPDELGLLIYTSGSTAAPKGVMSPHRAITFAAAAIAERLRYRSGDVVLTAIPLSFDYGLYQVFLSVQAGAHLVLSGPDEHVRLPALMRAHGATVVPVVPSLAEMLIRLVGRGSAEPPAVRLFTNTGAALTPPLAARLRAAFPTASIALMYGTTECKRTTIMEPDGDLDRPHALGRPLTGTRVTILGEDGRPVPAGETGEIVVSGPHVMDGYWNAPELTAERFRRDPETGERRLHSGDYGRLDADGHLYFEGRRDDLFKRRGVRMSCQEIEAAAVDVPGVEAAAVLPPADGHDLTVFAVTGLPAADVLAGLAERLEDAKVPADCRPVAGLPLTPNGKTDKRRLTELLG
jgi:amino acid adenylation domain-containing protein